MNNDTEDVVIVSANEIFREGLRRILIEQEFNVVLAAASADAVPGKWPPGLTVVDTQQFSEGLATCEAIRERCTDARIVLMMGEYRADCVATAFAAGAIDGFLVRAIACAPLAGALRLVAMGERLLPSQAVSAFVDGPFISPPVASRPVSDTHLSAQEIATLSCLVDGDSNKAIARRLRISEATVKVHVKSILRKLNLINRTQIAIYAIVNNISNRSLDRHIS